MRRCPFCGTAVRDDARICPEANCRQPLGTPPALPPSDPRRSHRSDESNERNRERQRLIVWIGIGAAAMVSLFTLLLLIAFAAWIFLRPSADGPSHENARAATTDRDGERSGSTRAERDDGALGDDSPVTARGNGLKPVKRTSGLNVPNVYALRTMPRTEELLRARGGTLESEAAVRRGLQWLVRHQADDGSWGTPCVAVRGTNPKACCEEGGPCSGPGSGRVDMAHTGLALLALQAAGHYYFNENTYSENVRRGLAWIIANRRTDGIFATVDPRMTERMAQRLSGRFDVPNVRGGRPIDPSALSRDDRFERESEDRLGIPRGSSSLQGGSYMYEQAIAVFALGEACATAMAAGREPEPEFLDAVVSGVRFIEENQHDDGGWRYTAKRSNPSDASVSGWQVLALKTAVAAGVDPSPDCLDKAEAYFKSIEVGRDGRTSYMLGYDDIEALDQCELLFRGRFPVESARLAEARARKTEKSIFTEATTGVGMLMHQFLLHEPDSPLVEAAADYLAQHAEDTWGGRSGEDLHEAFSDAPGRLPQRLGAGAFVAPYLSDIDYYQWYKCSLAMSQVGDERWQRWNNVVRDLIIDLQETDACARGSWDPNSRFGFFGGRIYSTALAVLTLEVYYRFATDAG